jgi:hypothetical protein
MANIPLTLKGSEPGQLWRATSDPQGTARFKVTMPAGPLPISLYMEGVEPPIATQELGWVEARPMASQVAEPILRERQMAKILVRFPEQIRPAERVVHLDVVDSSGAIVQSALLPVEDTPTGPIAQGSFEAPTWGSMLITLFALGKPAGAQGPLTHQQLGLLTEGQNMVVHPDRTLEVMLDGVPDQVRPGSQLTFKPRVRTPQGKEVEASVGVALVDQRIMALRDPLEVTPMDQLYNPTLRTMATVGAQILSWPVVSRNWGDARDDIALPPFPFLEGGPISASQRQLAAADAAAMEKEDEFSVKMKKLQSGAASLNGVGVSDKGYSSGGIGHGYGAGKAGVAKKIGAPGQHIGDTIAKPDASYDFADGPLDDDLVRPDSQLLARNGRHSGQGRGSDHHPHPLHRHVGLAAARPRRRGRAVHPGHAARRHRAPRTHRRRLRPRRRRGRRAPHHLARPARLGRDRSARAQPRGRVGRSAHPHRQRHRSGPRADRAL